MARPLLQLKGVVAGYARPITPPLTFHLEKGDRVGLYGPNGAGKSTLLKAILGEARLHAGALHKAPELRLAYLPQRPVRLQDTPLSGWDFLRYAGIHAPKPTGDWAKKLSLRLDHLSGGEYQMLCLWSSLAEGAEVVLLDEPTNNLDPAHRKAAMAHLLEGSDTRALLMVSHDRDFLARTCSQILDWH